LSNIHINVHLLIIPNFYVIKNSVANGPSLSYKPMLYYQPRRTFVTFKMTLKINSESGSRPGRFGLT